MELLTLFLRRRMAPGLPAKRAGYFLHDEERAI